MRTGRNAKIFASYPCSPDSPPPTINCSEGTPRAAHTTLLRESFSVLVASSILGPSTPVPSAAALSRLPAAATGNRDDSPLHDAWSVISRRCSAVALPALTSRAGRKETSFASTVVWSCAKSAPEFSDSAALPLQGVRWSLFDRKLKTDAAGKMPRVSPLGPRRFTV